jgi:DNA-binding CsgD family transcriptional regulator
MTKIFIIEPSYLIRLAVKNIIQLINTTFKINEYPSLNDFLSSSGTVHNSVIFINFSLLENKDSDLIRKLKTRKNRIVFISPSEINQAQADESIFLDDSRETVDYKMRELFDHVQTNGETEAKGLSRRETDVLKYVALGLTNKEIADKLFISAHTVITHRKNISAKLGIKTIAGFTVYALINKILLPEDVKQE